MYDEDNEVSKQYKVPGRSTTTQKKGKKSVKKYTPKAPKNEKRDKKQYYSKKVTSKATYKPLAKKQKGGKVKPLKSNFKKTNYIKEHERLIAKRDSLKKVIADPTSKNKNRAKVQLANNKVALQDLNYWKAKKDKKPVFKKQLGGPVEQSRESYQAAYAKYAEAKRKQKGQIGADAATSTANKFGRKYAAPVLGGMAAAIAAPAIASAAPSYANYFLANSDIAGKILGGGIGFNLPFIPTSLARRHTQNIKKKARNELDPINVVGKKFIDQEGALAKQLYPERRLKKILK